MAETYNEIIPDVWVSFQSTARCLGKTCLKITSGQPYYHYLGLSGTGVLCTISSVLSPSNWYSSYNKFFISSQLTAEGTLDIIEGYKPHTCQPSRIRRY